MRKDQRFHMISFGVMFAKVFGFTRGVFSYAYSNVSNIFIRLVNDCHQGIAILLHAFIYAAEFAFHTSLLVLTSFFRRPYHFFLKDSCHLLLFL